MRLLLFLAFLVVPVLEIWLLIQVGSVIGGWTTVALLLADSLLGAWIVRREGRKAWAALRDGVAAGRIPDRELADGALIVAGGTLLLAPGFLTDIVGFALVLPFTRPFMRSLATWFFARRVKMLAASSPYANLGVPFPAGRPEGQEGPQSGKVVHGEVIREDRDA